MHPHLGAGHMSGRRVRTRGRNGLAWPSRRGPRDRAGDRGSVLVITLVLVIVGSMVVVGIATFASALMHNRPPLDRRNNAAEAVRSGTRMAITLQREYGPRGCFSSSIGWSLNGSAVTTTCATVGTPYVTGSGRYGIIATSNRPGDTNISGYGATGALKDIDGPVFLNAGKVASTNTDLLEKGGDITYSSYTSGSTPLNRYTNPANAVVACTDPTLSTGDTFPSGTSAINGTAYTHTHTCVTDPWWTRAGDNPTGTGWTYPKLPQLPTYERSTPTSNGTCTIFYPGRYLLGGTLTLTGNNYFASGVYYFERPIVVASGATVTFGEGRYSGCSNDADAAFASGAPRNHEITGKGATILLGKTANITVTDASVRINRRLSTSQNRGSEAVSIRTVSFGVSSADVEVPMDQVALPDGSAVAANVHSIKPSALNPAVKYSASTLTPTSYAVDVQLNGGSSFSNRFIVDGYIFVPNAKLRVTSNVSSYQLRLTNGIVASSVQLALHHLPSSASTNYQTGVLTEYIQRRVKLQSSTTVNGRTVVSTATLEVHMDKSYAINSWVVDT